MNTIVIGASKPTPETEKKSYLLTFNSSADKNAAAQHIQIHLGEKVTISQTEIGNSGIPETNLALCFHDSAHYDAEVFSEELYNSQRLNIPRGSIRIQEYDSNEFC